MFFCNLHWNNRCGAVTSRVPALNSRRCAVYHKALTLHVSSDHLRPYSNLQITKSKKARGLQATTMKLIWRTWRKAKSASEAAMNARERIFDASDAGVSAGQVAEYLGSARYEAQVRSAHHLTIHLKSSSTFEFSPEDKPSSSGLWKWFWQVRKQRFKGRSEICFRLKQILFIWL